MKVPVNSCNTKTDRLGMRLSRKCFESGSQQGERHAVSVLRRAVTVKIEEGVSN